LGFGKKYSAEVYDNLLIDDVSVFLSTKVNVEENEDVLIYVEKILFVKKLSIEGIKVIME